MTIGLVADRSTIVQAGDPVAPPTSVPTTRRRGASRSCPKKNPSVKKQQRYYNKMFLLDNNMDITDEDLNVFDVTYPPLAVLTESTTNMKKWEPFVDVTEEKQKKLFKKMSIQMTHHNPSHHSTKSFKFENVEKHIRKLLKSSQDTDFFVTLEKQLFEYAITSTAGSDQNQTPLQFNFEYPYQRMICHGISQYYCLQSKSDDTKNGDRIVTVQKSRNDTIQYEGETLTNFLRKNLI